jgi:hypothetical protein
MTDIDYAFVCAASCHSWRAIAESQKCIARGTGLLQKSQHRVALSHNLLASMRQARYVTTREDGTTGRE